MTSVKRPLDGSIGSQVHLQGDAKKVKLSVQKEDIDQGKTQNNPYHKSNRFLNANRIQS